MDRLAWTTAWGGLLVLAFVNGALRRVYEDRLGDLRAHQVSSLVLLMLMYPWVCWVERRHPLTSKSVAVRVGLLWAGGTVAFEFVLGRLVNKSSWAELLNAYNLTGGRLWLFDVIGVAAAPALARDWRIRRGRPPRPAVVSRGTGGPP